VTHYLVDFDPDTAACGTPGPCSLVLAKVTCTRCRKSLEYREAEREEKQAEGVKCPGSGVSP